MAGDVALESKPSKSCCAALEKKLSKIELGRAALKQAIGLMDKRIIELEAENINLKKECEQERMRAELEREAKEKESGSRVELEKEICSLKSDIGSEGQDEGDRLLRTCVLEGEAEIKRLEELLEKERKRGDSERKKAEAEKKKAAEAWKLVKAEKSNAEQEKKLAEIERKRAEECRLRLEESNLEVNEGNVKLISEKLKVQETNKKAEAEKQRANREKKRADSETVIAEVQRKRAEVERQKALDEKTRADQFSQQLEEEKQRNEALQKEMQTIISDGNAKRACLCFRPKKCGSVLRDDKTETADKKVLNEQLKLEKMQTRHAKRSAKLEKVRNSLLRQELDLLKQDAVQFSRRLNMLDKCFFHDMEGIDSSAKIGDSSNQQIVDSNNRISGIKVCDLHCQNENELIKTRYTATDAFEHFKTAGECMRTLLPISGVSCTEPISGTNSELESLIGGSVRSKSQNSAICSTSTSFSDRQLMGSQGRGAFPTTSARLAEESSKQGSHIVGLSGKVLKKRYGDNVGEVAENNDRSQLNLTPYAKNEFVDKVPGHSRKRGRIQDTGESVVLLHSKDKLHSKIEEKVSVVPDTSGLKNKMPVLICSQSNENSKLLKNGKCLIPKPLDDFHVKKFKSSKKRKVAQKQKLVAQPCDQDDERKQVDQLEIEGNGDVLFCTRASLTAANRIRETVHACGDGTIDTSKSDMAATICFEDMFGGDIMKLLELDDPADEERYRIATENPVSPLLPEFDFHVLGEPQVDGFDYLVEGGHFRGLTIEEVNLAPPHNFDVIDVEINSDNHHLLHGTKYTTPFFSPGTSVVDEQNQQIYGAKKSHGSIDGIDHPSSLLELEKSCPAYILDSQERPTQNQGVYSLAINNIPTAWEQNNTVQGTGYLNQSQVDGEGMGSKKVSVSQSYNDSFPLRSGRLLNTENGTVDITEARENNADHVLLTGVEKEVAKLMPISIIERMAVHCSGYDGIMQGGITKHCVVFLNAKNEDSISRVICAMENCSSQTSMLYRTHWVVAEVLLALAREQDLMLEEKACVFFSLLLHNMSVMALVNSRSCKTGDFSFCSDSLAIEINRVVSDVETRRLFLKLCERNILLNLIEGFLTERTVLAYVDVLCAPLLPSDSGSRILFLGGRNMLISSKSATFNQLEAGGVILASICTATDNIGFICEASYNILRMCKDDLSWILSVLHIFASVCGRKYFAQRNYSSIMTTIKSIVLLLERGEELVGLVSSHYLTSASYIRPRFSPCIQCPFTEGAVCIDKVLTVLLEKLKEYANSGIRHQYLKKSATSSICTVQAQGERTEGSLEDVNGVGGQNMVLTPCCSSMDKRVVTLKAEFASDWTSSHFSDIVSLLELISCYMDWDWMYNNIVPHLLKLLACHVTEEFSAAIIILIGHVGRLGIDAGGYDQNGVEGLRCSLSTFLDLNITWEKGIPSQFAAAKALVDLLPLDFEGLVQKNLEVSIDSSLSGHTKIIKKWFSQLSIEQQSLYLSLLQSDVVQNA